MITQLKGAKTEKYHLRSICTKTWNKEKTEQYRFRARIRLMHPSLHSKCPDDLQRKSTGRASTAPKCRDMPRAAVEKRACRSKKAAHARSPDPLHPLARTPRSSFTLCPPPPSLPPPTTIPPPPPFPARRNRGLSQDLHSIPASRPSCSAPPRPSHTKESAGSHQKAPAASAA